MFTEHITKLRTLLHLEAKALPVGHISTYADGSQKIKLKSGKWVAYSKKKKSKARPATKPKAKSKSAKKIATKASPAAASKVPGKKAKVTPQTQGSEQSWDTFVAAVDRVGAAASTDEKMAALRYSDQNFTLINKSLREGKKPPGNTMKKWTKDLDTLIKRPECTLEKDTLLYRGALGPEALKTYGSMEPGDTFKDKAFTSTSASKGIAQESTARYVGSSDTGILLHVTAPKGTRAAPVGGVHGGDQEMILGRNTKFRVTKREEEKVDKKMHGYSSRINLYVTVE